MGSLVALDLATGEEAWWVYPGESGPRSTTISADGIAIVKDRNARLYAFDVLTGEHLWTKDGLGYNDPGPVVEGVLYSAGKDGVLYAIDVHTGNSLWSVTLPAGVDENDLMEYPNATSVGLTGPRPAAIDDGILTIAGTGGQISAVDLETHEVLWSAPCRWPEDPEVPAPIGDPFADTPVMAGGTIYISCNWEITHPGPGIYATWDVTAGGLIAFDARTGQERWRFQSSSRSGLRSPVIGPDALYTAGLDGVIYVLSPETGELTWQTHTGSPVMAPPTLAGNLLYVANVDGSISAYDATTWNLLWQIGHSDPQEPARNPATGPYAVSAGLAVVDDLLIVVSDASVIVLGEPSDRATPADP